MRPQCSTTPTPLGNSERVCDPSSDCSKACLHVLRACCGVLQTPSRSGEARCPGAPTALPAPGRWQRGKARVSPRRASPRTNTVSHVPGSSSPSPASQPFQLLPCSGLPRAQIRSYFCSPPLPHKPVLSARPERGALRRGFLKGPALQGTGRGSQLSGGGERTGQKRVTQSSQREGETGRSRYREPWEWGWGSRSGAAGGSERALRAPTRTRRRAEERRGRAEERRGSGQSAGPQQRPG